MVILPADMSLLRGKVDVLVLQCRSELRLHHLPGPGGGNHM